MTRAVTLGLVHGLLVFAAGFALGTARVLLVEPALGRWPAIALEFPLIALATFLSARFVVAKLDAPRGTASRLVVGFVGFLLLQAGEVATGVFAFGRPFAGVMAGYATFDGLIALVLQGIVILFPLLVRPSAKSGG
jgi:hypothetical protein